MAVAMRARNPKDIVMTGNLEQDCAYGNSALGMLHRFYDRLLTTRNNLERIEIVS
jgi:hypothetical protein